MKKERPDYIISVIFALLGVMAILLFLASCSKDNVLTEQKEPEMGFISFSGNIVLPEETSKIAVPPCSNETPNRIKFKLLDSNNLVFEFELPIILNGNTFVITESIEIPIGKYSVEEITLLSATGVETHSAPHTVDPTFPFAEYVDKPLPYDINITTEATVKEIIEVLCFNNEELSFNGELGLDGDSSALGVMWYWIGPQSCIDTIGVHVDGSNEILVVANNNAAYPIHVPKNTAYTINTYFENVLINTYRNSTGNDYSDSTTLVGDTYVYMLLNPCN